MYVIAKIQKNTKTKKKKKKKKKKLQHRPLIKDDKVISSISIVSFYDSQPCVTDFVPFFCGEPNFGVLSLPRLLERSIHHQGVRPLLL